MPDEPSALEPARRIWIVLFALATLGIVAGGVGYARFETNRIRREKVGDLATITNLKRDQLVQWRKERLSDVWRAANGPRVITLLGEWFRNPGSDAREELVKLLQINLKGDLYANACLVDSNGTFLLDAGNGPPHICPATERAVMAALAAPQPVLSEFCRHAEGFVHIDAVAAVPSGKAGPAVAMVLQTRPETGLFPLVRTWPISSESAEVLLVKREGASIVVLNELRHQTNTALTLHFSLAQGGFPSVMAAAGKEGPYLGNDYRNVRVLADLTPVTGTAWFLGAKVDADEILAEARDRTAWTALVACLFILLAGAACTFAYRQQQTLFFRSLYQAEREKRVAEETFRATFHSIGDAVVTTDTGGCVREMNPVAEALTGWPRREALGRPLEEIFSIVNEETRQPAENPARRALAEGTLIGLANHTLLLARDGTARPIADSAAPISGKDKVVTGVVVVFRDQTEERAAQTALQESEGRLNFALQATHLGAWDLDLRDHTARRTQIHDRIFGYDSLLPRWTYEQFLEHVLPEDRPVVNRSFHEAVAAQGGLDFECRIRRADGAERWIWVAGNHRRDAKGNAVRVAGIVQDITDRKRHEEQLRKTAEELARSNRELEQFAYVAAHDLKEPLRMVSAFSNLLQKHYQNLLDDAGNQYIEFAVEGANRMSALITGLLDYSRVGKQENVKTINADKPFREALTNLKAVLDESGARVESGPMPDIMGDEMQLTQLFQNLIGNAVKFRGAAPPWIRVSAAWLDGQWRFSVQDNGIGIDPAYQARIFEVFQRLHSREKYPGTGIGLAICKKIVESHGGRIWVESKPEAGSTFYFTIAGPAPEEAGRQS